MKVKGVASAWTKVLSGVPSGSVLGLLLFVFVENVDCQSYLYADDMKLYRIIANTADANAMQENLTKVVEWTEKW